MVLTELDRSVPRPARQTLVGWVALCVIGIQACATIPAPGASVAGVPSYTSGSAQTSGGLALPASKSEQTTTSTPIIAGEPLAEQSQDLTRYLEHHRLPLVRAEVRRDQYGNREVTLYGFVATPYGKSDAEAKARRMLGNPDLKVINAIKIRPELLALNSSQPMNLSNSPQGSYTSANQFAPGLSGLGSLGNWQSYQAQQAPAQGGSSSSWLDYLLPVLGVGAMIGLGFLGGGMGGFYPGMGYPFFP